MRTGRGRSASGNALLALSGQWGRYALQLLALVVFSRLLSPADFGLVAMVTGVVGIAYVIGDFGLSLAALQAEQLHADQRTNLFWYNTGIGFVVAALICVAAGPLASFYDDPRVAPVSMVLASVFLLNGIAVQFRTELNRELRFGVIAAADTLGQAAGFFGALVGALVGWSYWALVAMPVIAAVVTNAIIITWARWWPGWYRRGTPMRSLLTFGVNILLTQVINYVSTNIDQIAIGRVWGATALGFYNRAFQIARIPAQQVAAPLTRVVLPYLARLQGDPASYLEAVRKTQLALSTLLLSVLAFAAGTGDWLVPVILGDGWQESVPLLRVLCLAGALQAIGYVTYWVLLSQGKTGLLFATELGARLVMIALIIAAAAWGPLWVALAAAVGQALLLISAAFFALPRANVRAGPVLMPAFRPAVLFALAAVAAWIAGHLADTLPDIAALLIATVAFTAVCLPAMALPGYRHDVGVLLGFVRSVRGAEGNA
ncbi:membrane protein involved in the export of O-antigen and teichoic acid [Mycolicibacterium rhodesiae NBB3]|uniref:Membrane protein involved in the export of O-antigen and teichoic acid n=1 Tax=Mycolicibacterium rhodesiae (strain NBB3) TaxID=710685 RepID=G8RX47_MYCRN|nr:lipopolysaccharide biosynthesis protein [Mycolicibacterium rhodesiae]AEV71904.1 membrane protein involved in the export of O-antigen and teichoic acid [Mycolicibacterium rhodesiae NBB3]